MSRVKIQFSWDDGAYEDLKLLKYISKYDNLNHTFYIPANNQERKVVGPNDIKYISECSSIGSHTYHHTFLNTIPLSKVKSEVMDGRKYLEDIVGYEVKDFCYPGGKYNKSIEKEIKQIVSSARTTNLMCCKVTNNFNKNTTLQLVYRERRSLIKHIIAFAPIKIKMQLLRKISDQNYRLIDIIEIYLEYFENINSNNDNFLHIWGHSWEIEDCFLWGELDDIFSLLNDYNK